MYINSETKQIYRSQNEIRLAYPNTCFPIEITDEILKDFNIFPVTETVPNFDTVIEKATEIAPDLVNGEWIQQWSIQPKFDDEEDQAKAYQEHLEVAKTLKIEEINTARLEANTSFFIYKGKRISCDQLSRGDIEATNGIVLLTGGLPDGWYGFWKTADNEFIPINTVDEWKAFYKAMFDTGNNNFIKSLSLKQQVAAATTFEELKLISW